MKSIKASLLGEQTAENDKTLLLKNFIETPEYRSIIENKDSTVIVGRRGTGKSAMFAKLIDFWGSEKTHHIISVAPEDYQTIRFRSLFKPFEKNYSYARSVSRTLWKYGLLLEIVSQLSKHFKTREQINNDRNILDHAKRWQTDHKDFFSKISAISSPLINKDGSIENKLGDLPYALDLSSIEEFVGGLLLKSSIKFFILIDRLDEGYENDECGAAIISGAIAAIAELNKRHDKIRAIVFQRDNILRAVQELDPDYTRNIESEVLTIHWDTYQLQNLVAKRLNSAFSLNIENTQKIWDRCTANEGLGRDLQGIDGFKKCLQFTLYRPRDLLSLLNQAFYNAAREDRDRIILKDLEKTAKTISGNRLDDLKKEYKSIIPCLPYAITLFEDGSPELSYPTAISVLDNVYSALTSQNAPPQAIQDYAVLKSDGLLRSLYSIGFAGTHDEHSNTFTFCHDGRKPDREFTPKDRILIHPCYWIALNLSRNALAPEEAEQINDEYEIQVTSISPEIRSQRIGSLITELGQIPEGREHAYSFEKWTLTAIQTVFAGHLSNVEKSPNANAVQRRDIIGTNLAKSSTWSRIEKDYSSRQIIFEVKNYQSIGREEYRQMSTYLHGPYGRLGFIVTRDNDESLRAGSELDWAREIYNIDKKLIIRLSYKFFHRLLGKIRNPEKHDAVDNALSGILNTYERQYLSAPSTRKDRK